MVIGPNGTGKSTLVCAICLGLGWKTEHLGRAKDIGEFVKHGCSEAEIEIELAKDAQRHDSNPVVKLVIRKQGSKSAFYLNGRGVTRKRILDECQSFAIQVDNLCQFLPQDRVVEFAALSPVDLLAQTQRAAAPPEMTEMHENLKEMHVQRKKLADDQTMLADSLKNLEGRQNLQRVDVERIQQRKQLQTELKAMKLYRPLVEYHHQIERFKTAKAKRQRSQNELDTLKEEVEPTLRAVTAKKEYCGKVREVFTKRNKIVDRAVQSGKVSFTKQDVLSKSMKDIEANIQAEKDRERKVKQERGLYEKRILELERQMESTPPDFDAADYNERLRALNRDMEALKEKAIDEKTKESACAEEIESRNTQVRNLENEIKSLRTLSGQRENTLKRESHDTLIGWKWYQENKSMFEGEIFAPPILSISVKNTSKAFVIETVVSHAELCAFTVTRPADFSKLSDKLQGELKLRDIYIRSSSISLSTFQPSVPRERLADLGLDGYVMDLIEGPEPVLAMLCDNRSIHQTATASRAIDASNIDLISKTAITSFITPTETYNITRRREYGDRATSTRTRQVRPAKIFTDQQVDTGTETNLQDKIKEIQMEISDYVEKGKEHKSLTEKHRQRYDELKSQHSQLQAEKNTKQAALSQFNALPTKLEAEKTKIQGIVDKVAACQVEVAESSKKLDQLVQEKAQAALSYANIIFTMSRSLPGVLESELASLEAESDLQSLEERNKDVNAMLETKKLEVEQLASEVATCRQEGHTMLKKCQEIKANLTPEEAAIHERQSQSQSLENLDGEIEGLEARLEMVHEGNTNILKEYEERGQKIERTTEKLTRTTRSLETLESSIEETRARWEPQLEELVKKISDAFGDNFRRIGCLGEVHVFKTDDFASWSIQILVAFRYEILSRLVFILVLTCSGTTLNYLYLILIVNQEEKELSRPYFICCHYKLWLELLSEWLMRLIKEWIQEMRGT